MKVRSLAFALALLAAQAAAQGAQRDFCPDRPGLGTPPCIIDKGDADLELGLLDWSLEREAGTRTDTFELGDTLVRYGLTGDLEMQVGWTALGIVRMRDPSGAVTHETGTGDVRLALRRSLAHPDGEGFSIAVMPYVDLPTGGRAIGAGTWGAGLLLPMSRQLKSGIQLDFTGEIDAAPDEDRHGRHLAYSGIAGLDLPLPAKVTATFELEAARDEDPSGATNRLRGALAVGWMARDDLQLDAGGAARLAGSAPSVELYVGVAKRF
jgi:hypothetical protein